MSTICMTCTFLVYSSVTDGSNESENVFTKQTDGRKIEKYSDRPALLVSSTSWTGWFSNTLDNSEVELCRRGTNVSWPGPHNLTSGSIKYTFLF